MDDHDRVGITMHQIKRKNTGMALTTIMLAVVLLAAIAVSIAMSARSGNAGSNQERTKLLATTVLSQAQQIKNNMELAISNGVDISSITASYANPVTNFSPASAGIASQVAPADATTNLSLFSWLWHGTGNLVKLMNVGSGAGNYVIELDPLTQSVCRQINQAIFNNPAIPTSATTNWGLSAPVDASADSAVDGKQEGCFYSSVNGSYFYYKVILVQ